MMWLALGVFVGLALSPWLAIYSVMTRSDVYQPRKSRMKTLIAWVSAHWFELQAAVMGTFTALLAYAYKSKGKPWDWHESIIGSVICGCLAWAIFMVLAHIIKLPPEACAPIASMVGFVGADATKGAILDFIRGRLR